MANRMEAMRAKAQAMKSKAAEAGKAKETAMAARQTQLAKAGERLKAEEATMSEAGKARIKAAQEAATKQAKRNPTPANSPYNKPPAGGMKAALDKAIANRPAAKPAMPARPMGGGMGARPAGGTSGSMGARPISTARPTERIPRPAGTVSPNAAKMVGKTFGGMGMKKGGRAKK